MLTTDANADTARQNGVDSDSYDNMSEEDRELGIQGLLLQQINRELHQISKALYHDGDNDGMRGDIRANSTKIDEVSQKLDRVVTRIDTKEKLEQKRVERIIGRNTQLVVSVIASVCVLIVTALFSEYRNAQATNLIDSVLRQIEENTKQPANQQNTLPPSP